MNANELADLIELCGDGGYNQDAAKMLRVQEDLINCLRMGQPNIDYDKELLKPTFVGRQLTDEEILEIANQCLIGATAWHNPDLDPIDFARAILRKAQEK
jgi:hypothetical protein